VAVFVGSTAAFADPATHIFVIPLNPREGIVAAEAAPMCAGSKAESPT